MKTRRLLTAGLAAALTLSLSLSASAQTYTVKAGDTLWGIAKRHQTTCQELASTNSLRNPSLIYPGQVLTIPDQTPAAPSTAPTVTPAVPTQQPTPAQPAIDMSKPADGFRVMIVGSGSPTYDPDRGQPSALVQYKDKYFLVDCGNRTADTLVKNGIQLGRITNILMTHQHFDHNADFWDVFMGGGAIINGRTSLNLYGPDVQRLYDATVSYYKDDIDQRIEGLNLPTTGLYGINAKDLVQPTEAFELDGVKISAMLLPHGLPNYAYKFEADGKSIVISGDLLNAPEFAAFTAGADLLVMDGMLTSSFSTVPEVAREGLKSKLVVSHLTQAELGAIVAEAQPKNLILTHLGGDSNVEATTEYLTTLGYTGTVADAYDGMVFVP